MRHNIITYFFFTIAFVAASLFLHLRPVAAATCQETYTACIAACGKKTAGSIHICEAQCDIAFDNCQKEAEESHANCTKTGCPAGETCKMIDSTTYACVKNPPTGTPTTPTVPGIPTTPVSAVTNPMGSITPPFVNPHGQDVQTGAGPFINSVIQFVTALAGIAFLFTIIFSGLQIITKARSPEDFSAAVKRILFSVIGLFLVLCAYIIVGFLSTWLTGNSSTFLDPFSGLK